MVMASQLPLASSRLTCAIARRIAPIESPTVMLVVEAPPTSSTDRPTFGVFTPSIVGQSATVGALQHVLEGGAPKKIGELRGTEVAPLAEAYDDRSGGFLQCLLYRSGLVQDHRDRAEFAWIEAQRVPLRQRAAQNPVHLGFRADDGVAFVVADHDRVAGVPQIPVHHLHTEGRPSLWLVGPAGLLTEDA